MKYFRLMHSGIDVTSLLEEVRANEDAWLLSTGRQDKIAVQRDTNTIYIRTAVRRPDLNVNENQESEYTNVSSRFPRAVAFFEAFAAEMKADLSRATIVRLKPQSRVYPHTDAGAYYFVRDRYHLVLYSSAGSILISGGEQVRMRAGELWWFDNKQHHEAMNESDEWRIHYIFDLLPHAYRHLGVNPAIPLPEAQRPVDVTGTEAKDVAARGHGTPTMMMPSTNALRQTGEKDGASGHGVLQSVKQAVSLVNQKLKAAFMPQQPAASSAVELAAAKLPALLSSTQKPATVVNEALPELKPDKKSIRDFVVQSIRDFCIIHATPECRIISPSGKDNSWQIDMRRLFMDSRMLDAAATLFWDECASLLPFQVGGMEVAAIPLVSAILMKGVQRGTPVNGFIARKERKTHGQGRLYEGTLTDAPILVVDDLINSGSSLEKVRAILANEGKNIDYAFVLVDYESARGFAWREQHRVNIVAPYKLSDFGLSVDRKEPPPLPRLFSEIWHFTSPDPNFHALVPKSFPVTDGKRVYYGSDSGTLWALDALKGSVAWSFKVFSRGHKNIFSAPALHDGKIYFGSYDGNVYCLEAATGKEIWRFESADWVGSSPALAPDIGMLFIGLEFAVEGKRGSIIGLNLHTGKKVWEHRTRRYTHASPAYWPDRQLVACGSNDNEMFLFEARTGKMLWRFETRGEGGEKGSIRHAPAFDAKRGHLITGCADHYIYVIDIETGKEVWSVKTHNTIYTVPLVVGDLAFVGSTDKYMYVLDLEARTVRKKLYAGSKIFGPPRLLDGAVFYGATNGVIYQLDPRTADVTGTCQLPDAVTCALTYSPETSMFYAVTYMNQLFALARA